jgi:hypothetical protein
MLRAVLRAAADCCTPSSIDLSRVGCLGEIYTGPGFANHIATFTLPLSMPANPKLRTKIPGLLLTCYGLHIGTATFTYLLPYTQTLKFHVPHFFSFTRLFDPPLTYYLRTHPDMNSHIGLQARVYDYERTAQDVLRPADANEEQSEMDVVEASAEAEIEVEIVEEPEKSGNVGLDADQIRKNGVALNGSWWSSKMRRKRMARVAGVRGGTGLRIWTMYRARVLLDC